MQIQLDYPEYLIVHVKMLAQNISYRFTCILVFYMSCELYNYCKNYRITKNNV